MKSRLLMIHCLSPLHAGTGQGVGAVDLPIAREVSTALPYLPGSTIKGCLRNVAGQRLDESTFIEAIFGCEPNATDEEVTYRSGSVSFGDANLLSLPARSVYGTFAWVTSSILLRKLFRDCSECGFEAPIALSEVIPDDIVQVRHSDDTLISHKGDVVFEDLDFSGIPSVAVSKLADWIAEKLFSQVADRDLFRKRFVVVHDDILTFLSEYALDVVTRTRIDTTTGTVAQSQLWTEENLPTESILVSLVSDVGGLMQNDSKLEESLDIVCTGTVQFGGHATIGRGRCAIHLEEKQNEQ